MIEVVLTPEESTYACSIGELRHQEAIRQGRPDQHGAVGSSYDAGLKMHQDGAAGELAAAKALGRPWAATVNTYKRGGDLGENVQVRLRRKLYYDLIVRKGDRPDDYYILVLRELPATKFWVVGWIQGKDAQRDEWWNNYGGYGGAWFVPQNCLTRFPDDNSV